MFSFPLKAPLAAASSRGHIETVALLLQANGVDVNKEVSIKCLPLSILSITAVTNLLRHLRLQSPLALASKYGHAEVVVMLLQAKGIDVNKEVNIMIPTLTILPLNESV